MAAIATMREPELEQEAATMVAAAPGEQDVLRAVQDLLGKATVQQRPRLVGPDGEQIELPVPLVRLLRQSVPHLLEGHALSLVPLHKELTTQEAADLLNVSRPFLIGLLERGELPYTKTGTHRRIRYGDLTLYKRMRDANRRRALDRLTELSQEFGLDAYQD